MSRPSVIFRRCWRWPRYGKKHRDNTLTMKRFTNGVASGAWAVKRQKTTVKSQWMAGYDELAAFDDDIEQEGFRRSWGQAY
ncbi:hypothetical protein LQQ63_26500 (plasmid) [Escherichia coli]|nr:hypothetical protein LQQ63_26500 [Escherichia coli]